MACPFRGQQASLNILRLQLDSKPDTLELEPEQSTGSGHAFPHSPLRDARLESRRWRDGWMSRRRFDASI